MPKGHDIFFRFSNICTKRMLGREKSVRHVSDIFKGACLILVRHLRQSLKTNVFKRVLFKKQSPAAGFTAHDSTRFWRVLAARAYRTPTEIHSCQSLFPSRQTKHPWKGHIKPVARGIEVSHAACKDDFRRSPRSLSSSFVCFII